MGDVLSFIRGTWVTIAVVIIVGLSILFFSNLSWDSWAESTFDAGGVVKEVKIDRLKITQQFVLLLITIAGFSLAIWRSLTAHRQATAALEQSKTALRQAENAENTQRFDRYARAAQMLDSEKAAVRQAGVYLLRELAEADENYRDLCIELLVSFILSRNSDGMNEVSEKGDAAKLSFAEIDTPHDVVDAFRNLCKMRKDSKIQIQLPNIVLRAFEFRQSSNLTNIDFDRSVFSRVHAYGSIFDKCLFGRASFSYNNIRNADFKKVRFWRTTFKEVDFIGVDFTGSTFRECQFFNCKFEGCNLSDVGFYSKEDVPFLPFDSSLLKECWNWEGSPLILDQPFVGRTYTEGEHGIYRKSFSELRERHRAVGGYVLKIPYQAS